MPPAGAKPSLTRIEARDNSFEPLALKLQSGTTVQFVNTGKMPHNVTSDDGRWDSGDIPPGGTFNATFVHPGTYHFHCRYHLIDKMVGTITVEESRPPAANQQPNAPAANQPGAPPAQLPPGGGSAGTYK